MSVSNTCRRQMASKCGKNKKKIHMKHGQSVSLISLPHFDVFWDLLPNDTQQHKIHLFYMLYNKETQTHVNDVNFT